MYAPKPCGAMEGTGGNTEESTSQTIGRTWSNVAGIGTRVDIIVTDGSGPVATDILLFEVGKGQKGPSRCPHLFQLNNKLERWQEEEEEDARKFAANPVVVSRPDYRERKDKRPQDQASQARVQLSCAQHSYFGLEYKRVDPADPVYIETRNEDSGDLVHTYTSLTMAPVLSITNEDLLQLMHQILQIFPTFGCCMIDGLASWVTTSPHLAFTSCTITFMAPQFLVQTISQDSSLGEGKKEGDLT
ncbi:hypothetical protein DFH07DRAFT_770569 [Mycena maculata]|uniref:Uncharacterized protein n=1 Tax=Mycena maculata TaxID=230809 RepID=A0AAD7JGU3_9AGAR|nr:hypothetical protein DFH07DRAFT_770569 [Mycena maculata]